MGSGAQYLEPAASLRGNVARALTRKNRPLLLGVDIREEGR
jgi:hypothetical protein